VGVTEALAPKRDASQLPESCRRVSTFLTSAPLGETLALLQAVQTPHQWVPAGHGSAAAIRRERERIVVRGMVDTRPVALNKTHEGRAKNRRIEALVDAYGG